MRTFSPIGIAAATLLLTVAMAGCAPTHLDLAPFALPVPAGPDPVGTIVLHVPADPARGAAETMAQLWYPAASTAVPGSTATAAPAGWTSPQVQAADSAALAQLLGVDAASIPDLSTVATHATPDAPAAAGAAIPLVLFSPGAGLNRTSSTGLAEQLASVGIATLAVDAPGDSTILFPDGRLSAGTLAATLADAGDTDRMRAFSERAAADRAAVMLAALDQVTAAAAGHAADGTTLPAGLGPALELDRVVTAGHSLGGAAALVAASDPRAVGAIDLDGTPWGDPVTRGVAVSALLVTSADTDPDTDPHLRSFLTAQRAGLARAGIPTARHYSFTDLEWWAPQLGAHAAGLLGSADPTAIRDALGEVIAAFVRERTTDATGLVPAAIAAHPLLAQP